MASSHQLPEAVRSFAPALVTCDRCGAEAELVTGANPDGRHGDAYRLDYRCSECSTGGAVIVRNREVVREVGPVFEQMESQIEVSA